MYTVKRTEDQLWTVGEVSSNGEFEPVSDHGNKQEAEDEATRLNGGTPIRDYKKLYDTVYALLDRIDELEKRVDELQDHVGTVQETYVRQPRKSIFGE